MKTIAHRGASGYAPENTKLAMIKALEMGSDGFEVDLQLTADGKVVVIHDWTLERTSNGTGFVRGKTLEELRKLDIGTWFGKGEFSEQIMTLEELLEIIPKDKILNLEIKVLLGEKNSIEEKVIKILEEKDRIDQNIIISSFDHSIIKKINKIKPELRVGLLITAGLLNIGDYIEQNNLNIYSLHCSGEFLSVELMKVAKTLGIKVFVWTVNEIEHGEIFNQFGVDGIITNYPDRFIK
ncbi:MAG: glycerophosphodiester phosphodiesterase [Psychrilyobacter sp.]|nr:glycerophosphodiester phosphodiesterase [Psychrilyobacter sp.]